MKKIIVILALILSAQIASASFVSAKIKVTGVTCSMCSNSVQKALSSLSFVENIDVDLENAVFKVTFKKGESVVADLIKEKVEGAGFSVGELVMDFQFQNQPVKNDFHFNYNGNTYHFVNVKEQQLNSTVSLRFVDKGMTGLKEHKKYVGLTTYECIKTGKMQSCCNNQSLGRIYHVTI